MKQNKNHYFFCLMCILLSQSLIIATNPLQGKTLFSTAQAKTITNIYDTFYDEINITPNAMMEFSNLSRQDILSYRISAVNNSPLFQTLTNYTPSPSVYQIENNKPWIGAHEISCSGHVTGKGASRESIGILNPELLYYIAPESYAFEQKSGCSSVDYLEPTRITYSPSQNLITAYINYSAFYTKNGTQWIYIRDANARDFGYNYAYADQTDNINFNRPKNFSTEAVKTRGFYHKGNACKVSGGCNNYSPFEDRYFFSINQIPAAVNIKLWKDSPSNLTNPADITFRFIFE